MFKAEELGGRNRNCWYSTSESEGRKWDLVFLTSIFTLKYYSLDVSATKFWQKSFEALRRVGGRQFQINVLAPSALGSVSAFGVFLETEPTSALSSCGCAISFPEAAILLVSDGADQKDRGL